MKRICGIRIPVRLWLMIGVIALIYLNPLQAQENDGVKSNYVMDFLLQASPVKDQGLSGTCWSFASISFLESELMRTGKGNYDLSEMFAVRTVYLAKAEKYIRMHGTINFGEGGEANDVTDALAQAGMVPESVYPGPDFNMDDFDFEGMDRVLKDLADRVIHSSNEKLDHDWKIDFERILDQYMGEVPSTFDWQGKSYSPGTFAEGLGLSMDDYVLVGSYMHHPFYTDFILEIPDNWSWEPLYNLPLDEMMEVLDRSLEQGFTVVWAADISEPGFSFKEGLVLVRKEDGMIAERSSITDMHGASLQEGSLDNAGAGRYTVPFPVTQEERQGAFDRYETQDDHAMHIIGKAHDISGNRYYYIKNSWGNDNALQGYLYASEEYLRYKTISFFVNKNALEPELRNKLGIQ